MDGGGSGVGGVRTATCACYMTGKTLQDEPVWIQNDRGVHIGNIIPFERRFTKFIYGYIVSD
eukprot:750343-Hanusia_phi.AAC.1